MKSGEMKLEEEKKKHIMRLNQIWMEYKNGDINQKSKKIHCKLLNCFTNHE